MRRDMNLCREILCKAGGSDDVVAEFSADDFPGYSRDHLMEHVFLLEQEGLIAPGLQTMGARLHIRLTATGNDFLDLASNDKVWKKTLDDLAKKGIGLTLDLVIQALQSHFSGLLG